MDGPEPVLNLTVPIYLTCAAVSPDGRLLAFSEGDITLKTLPEGRTVGVLKGHTRKGILVAFSPDGRTIASIADDHTTRLWHVGSMRELIRFPASTEDRESYQVEFSPDGRAMATYRHDGTNAVVSLHFAPSFAEIAAAEGGDYRSLAGTDAPTWHEVSRELLRGGRLEAAWEACSRAEELAAAREEIGWWLRPTIRRHRLELLRRMGRIDEAGRENLALLGAHGRDPATPDGAIDLSAYFNGGLGWDHAPPDQANDLREVPTGWQRLGGTGFDVRGTVTVEAPRPGQHLLAGVSRVEGIRIGRRVDRLHFLQMASGDSLEVRTGDRIGHYRIHYADGRSVEVPIRYNVDVSDYWELEHLPKEVPGASVVWRGQNPRRRRSAEFIRLFRCTWENPHPEAEVSHIDLVAERPGTSPWLVALTAE